MKSAKAAQFSSPLGEQLVFYAMRGRETLGQPFSYEVDLLSDDPKIELDALLGQPVSVSLERYDGGTREFNGFVAHFSLIGSRGRYVQYRALLKPWLWFLGHSRSSRIFHKKTVPAILKQIFRERGFTDFTDAELSSDYREWEYLVQYRESELNFVSRLMEQEGIYYYFEHSAQKHKLILADSPTSHRAPPEYKQGIKYFPPVERERRDQEHVDHWLASMRVRSGKFRVGDYDFKRPAQYITAQAFVKREHPHSSYEVSDYPGEVSTMAEAEREARVQLEEHQVEFDTVEGSGNPRGLSAGSLFALTQFPREDQNKEYLIVDAIYDVRVGEYESTTEIEDKDPEYRLSFTAIDAKHQYRAPRVSKKPVVEGPQTAKVLAEGNQEIWTDEYGRVKVLFHWDSPAKDKSCWVRVAQVWAGTNFGAMHIPRANQEVIVDFLEGDPDRPIITGRVYNAENMPPYPLPKNQTQSGIRSRSTKGGNQDEFNELMFEDKRGEEKVNLQAQKDLHIEVKNDETDHIARNRTTDIDKNETTTIGENETHHVKGKQTETVDQGLKHTVTMGIDREVTSGGVTEKIMGGVTQTITGNVSQDVVGSVTNTASTGFTFNTPAAVAINAQAGFTLTAPAGSKILATGGHSVIAPGGQTTVDNFFSKIGGQLLEVFQNHVETKPYKLSAVATADSLIGLKTDVVGLKIDLAKVVHKNNQMTIAQAKMELKKATVIMYTVTLLNIK
jgi:type VI secretion system secreted protein VgrG